MNIAILTVSATALFVAFLTEAGEKAVETVGEKLPDKVGKLWDAIAIRFKNKSAAEKVLKDLVANPNDEDIQAAFRIQLRRILDEDPELATELTSLLRDIADDGTTVTNTGSGAVATSGGVAAGAGGAAVKGDVYGGIVIGPIKRGLDGDATTDPTPPKPPSSK